jgi:hypothetical protein
MSSGAGEIATNWKDNLPLKQAASCLIFLHRRSSKIRKQPQQF